MTISTQIARAQYAGNGVTTSFAVPFEFLTATPPKVVYTDAAGLDTVWVLTTNYTLTGGGAQQPATGSITALVAPASGTKITLLRNEALTQAADYIPNDPFPAVAHEKALDRLSMQNQMINEKLGRSIGFKESSASADIKITDAPEGGKVLGYNADGTSIINKTPVDVGVAGAAGAAIFGFDLPAEIRDYLDLVPGVDVQAHSDNLDELALINAGSAGKTNLAAEDFEDALATPVDGTVTDAKLPTFGDTSPTAGKISFTQTGTGALARPLIAKIKDGPVSLEDFAYVSGNALTALNNAIACGQPIQLGPKQYDIDGIVTTISNREFMLKGTAGYGATKLRFTGTTSGLTVTQDDFNNPTHIENISILTTQQEQGTGLNVTYSKTDSINNRNHKRCRIIDIDVRGDDYLSQGWSNGIVLTDVHNAEIIRPVVIGRRDAGVSGIDSFNKMSAGILFQGSDTPTLSAVPSDVLIDNPRIADAVYGIYTGGEVEGLSIENPFLIGVVNGVYGRMTTERPFLSVRGGHMNVFARGVDLQNMPQSIVSGILVYKFQQTVTDTIAVKLDNCDDCNVSGLTLINLGTDVATSGNWHGVNLINSDRCYIDKILHNRPSSCVLISGTSTGNRSRNIVANGAYTGATQAIVADTSSGINRYGNDISSFKNASAVATVTAAGVAIGSIDLSALTLYQGEKYRVTVKTTMVKGATAGMNAIQVAKSSGTSTVTFNFDEANMITRSYSPLSETVDMVLTGTVNISATGTLIMGVTGFSFGSDASIAAGKTQWNIEKIG